MSFGTLKLIWNKPLGTTNIVIPAYRVMRSETSSYEQAVEVDVVTKCSFTDTDPGIGNRYYWVIAVNSYGNSAESDVCIACAKPIPA